MNKANGKVPHIDSVKNQELIKTAELVRSKMLDTYSDFNLKWLKTNDWVAVPAEDNGPYQDEVILRLSNILPKFGIKECWGILTEDLTCEKLFKFKPSEQGLVGFRIECNGFYYLLTEPAASFAILCTAYDFFIYAGNREIVEAMAGESVAAAKKRYLEYANRWKGDDLTIFTSIAERYEEFG